MKKVTAIIKLQCPAGKANPSPPVGPALGQHGLNIMAFCKEFNARTAQMGDPAFEVDYTHEAIEQITAKTEFRANLAVIRTADEMTDSLLDILA